jgi:hypothetical protein
MLLTVKRTDDSRQVGPWPYEDYKVFDGDDHCVGHVLHYLEGPDGRLWFWSIDASESQDERECGYAMSREGALTALETKLECGQIVVEP